MPSDRSARNTHSFLPYHGYASRSPSPLRPTQLSSSFGIASTPNVQPSPYGPQQTRPYDLMGAISATPCFQMHGPQSQPVSPPPLTTANVAIPQASLVDQYLNPQILFMLPPSPTPSTPYRHASTTNIDLSPSGPSFDTSFLNDAPRISSNLRQNSPHTSLLQPSLEFLSPNLQYSEDYHLVPQSFPGNTSALTLVTQPHTNVLFSSHPTPSVPVDGHYANPQARPIPQCADQLAPSSFPPPQTALANIRPSGQQNISPGMFHQAHNFVINDSVFIENSSDNFLASFLKETIPGAEFDSSDPNMPIRCHPGTRLEIIKRCQDFILTCNGPQKLRWVVGAAGVGKSAIMQSVAQAEFRALSGVTVGATIFFSINGRQDGTKTITTIAYQLAVKLDPYCVFIQREITRDPSLLQKSLTTQFKKFIVEPFIHHGVLLLPSRLLIILDGLDECANPVTQRELLGLISDFCITYPTSPIVWMIASRPEPHITSFFAQPQVALSYDKEEILVDSDAAHEDIKRYLRDKFREVQMASITLQRLSQWPSEAVFSKVAGASGGLFAYASAVIRYINDPTCGDPVGQLNDVLNIIDEGTKSKVSGHDHPMAQLDALYAHIMSKIPAKIEANTRKLLLLYAGGTGWTDDSLRFSCNMLGMTADTAYGAVHSIRSIARIPGPDDAACNGIEFFHKSFPDYLRDFKRSGFSPNIEAETERLVGQCALRIIGESPDGVYVDGASDDDLNFGIGGIFKNNSGSGDNILVSWSAVGEYENREIRFKMFRRAVWDVMGGLRRKEGTFRGLLSIQVLATCFAKLPQHFPIGTLRDVVFDETRRRELLDHRILKQMSVKTLDYDKIPKYAEILLRFRSQRAEAANTYDISCKHTRKGRWEGHNQDWSTKFLRSGGRSSIVACHQCFQRFTLHFQMQSRGHPVTVLDMTPTYRVVELRFVDPEDGVSEWTYVFDYGDRWRRHR